MNKVGKVLLIAGVVVLGLAFLAARQWWPHGDKPAPQPENEECDPRLWYKTDFRNVRPDVQYVGTAACAKCHHDYAEAYSHHPMGRSLAPIAEVAPHQNYSKEVGNPFESAGLQFLIERHGDQITHHEIRQGADGQILTETAMPVQYVVGSGTHAYAYLSERDGLLFESPIAWFAQKGAWDVSPGFKERRDSFERLVLPGCVFCHCNHAKAVPNTLNRYETPIFQGHAIGCERCHGPGELHVRDRENGLAVADVDTSIVNPRHLPTQLREAVCEQCHLGGHTRILRRGRDVFDYRPGLPFDLFWAVFVKPGRSTEEIRLAGHVEQMHTSLCYRASNGKLGCTSCHDPHMLPRPEDKDAYYRTRCLNCHETKGCSIPADVRRQTTATDSCMVCHMPNINTDLSHIAVTDHRLRRRSGGASDPVLQTNSPRLPLASFYDSTIDPRDGETARDLGVALMDLARHGPSRNRVPVSRLVTPWLEVAVGAHPDDLDARDGLSVALGLQNRLDDALQSCEGTLRLAPQREATLSDAAMMARALGQRDLSLRYWQSALAVNPWSSRYRYEAARLLGERQEWDKVLLECQHVLKYNAAHVPTRVLLVEYYLHQGDKELARTEFKTVLALKPPNAEELERWFLTQAGP